MSKPRPQLSIIVTVIIEVIVFSVVRGPVFVWNKLQSFTISIIFVATGYLIYGVLGIRSIIRKDWRNRRNKRKETKETEGKGVRKGIGKTGETEGTAKSRKI